MAREFPSPLGDWDEGVNFAMLNRNRSQKSEQDRIVRFIGDERGTANVPYAAIAISPKGGTGDAKSGGAVS
jgi:hypothetical protein